MYQISSGAKCVWKNLSMGLPLLTQREAQVLSFFLLLWAVWTSLQYLQVVQSLWQSFLLLQPFTIWGSLGLHVSAVCRFISMYLFELNWSRYPTASQHCLHNQSSHPKICYITFYFKASFPREVMQHIQYESRKFKSARYLQHWGLIKHKVVLNSWIWATVTSLIHVNIGEFGDTYLLEKGRKEPFIWGNSWGDEPRKWRDLSR